MNTPSQFSIDALHTATPTARSSTMHIHSQADEPPSANHPADALHTAIHSTARSSTMHIYRRQMEPPSQSSIDALHIATPTARYSSNAYISKTDGPPSQLSIDALHTTTPTARCSTIYIYIEGRWTPQSS